MLNDVESIMSIPKSYLHEACKELTKDDITRLVDRLSLKDDQIRYQAFLLLQSRSALYDDVYPFWELFHEKLKSENSYQRSIGLMLIAENVKWDMKNKMENVIDDFMACLYDPKPITVRQCIQSLGKIAAVKPSLCEKISSKLISYDITAVKETMQKSILTDILNVLLIIRQEHRTKETETFISNALFGDILDKKTKKQIEALLHDR